MVFNGAGGTVQPRRRGCSAGAVEVFNLARNIHATLEITGGTDLRTLKELTGHAQTSTLVNTYSHAIKRTQVAAGTVLENILKPATLKYQK
jgi:hypothetical protein